MNKLKLTAAVLAAVTALFSCRGKSGGDSVSTSPSDGGTAEDGNYPDLTVTFLDVGKADSMIIRTENSTVVIDCGEKGDGKDIVKFLENHDVTTIDYLIITHYDKDHVGGAAKVINSFEVLNVLGPDYQELSQETDKFRSAMKEKLIVPKMMTEELSFELDGAEYTVYAPEKDFYGLDDDNDFSLVTKLRYHGTTFIFTGDAMQQRLDEVMDIGGCDLLKIPYHGRKISNLEQFIEETSPEYAVICTSKEEFAPATREILDSNGVKYWSTCYNGSITAVSDGNSITVTAESDSLN